MVNNAPLIPPKWLQNYSTLTPLGKFCPHMQTYAYLWGWDHVATFSNTFEKLLLQMFAKFATN